MHPSATKRQWHTRMSGVCSLPIGCCGLMKHWSAAATGLQAALTRPCCVPSCGTVCSPLVWQGSSVGSVQQRAGGSLTACSGGGPGVRRAPTCQQHEPQTRGGADLLPPPQGRTHP